MTRQLLGIALGWKFNHESGITTAATDDLTDYEIVEWPEAALGPQPTRQQEDDIIAEFLQKQDYAVKREAAYNAAGISASDLALALYEATVENNTTMLDAIKAKRDAIKQQFPKPAQRPPDAAPKRPAARSKT